MTCTLCKGAGEVQVSETDWDDCRRCDGTGELSRLPTVKNTDVIESYPQMIRDDKLYPVVQSKKMSFIESLVNTFVGFIVTLIFSPIIYWACDVEISLPQMGLATLLFTLLSIARNYCIRRFFTKK